MLVGKPVCYAICQSICYLIHYMCPYIWTYITHCIMRSLTRSIRLRGQGFTNEPILSSNHLERRTPRLHCAAPVSLILCTAPLLVCSPSTSVAFFVTLWFSDLVPYVLILKTFHIRNLMSRKFSKSEKSFLKPSVEKNFLSWKNSIKNLLWRKILNSEKYKNLWRRKCVRRAIFQNVEVRVEGASPPDQKWI